MLNDKYFLAASIVNTELQKKKGALDAIMHSVMALSRDGCAVDKVRKKWFDVLDNQERIVRPRSQKPVSVSFIPEFNK